MCVLALSNLNSQNPALLPKTSKEAEFLEDEKNDRWERLLDNPHKQERERANSEFGRYGRKSRNVSLLIFFALVTVITVPMLFTDH
jgi:hypothetical protein